MDDTEEFIEIIAQVTANDSCLNELRPRMEDFSSDLRALMNSRKVDS